MQLTVAAAFLAAAASLTSAQSVPASAPGCVKYCLRIAREQAPSACTWAGWCNTSGFQDSVTNCYNNICGPANQQAGAQVYQQICSSAGTSTECPTSGVASATSSASSIAASASSAVASVTSSAASEASSATATATSDLVTTTIGGVATTIPASFSSSIAAGLSSSAAGASSAASSASASISSAVSTATAPVSSVISSILNSASSAAASASSAAASATSAAPNAGVTVNLPSNGQIASIGAILFGAVAGALML